MTTMRCPDCDGTESVLATDGATAMCAECPGMSGDGVEMAEFDDEAPSDEPVTLHTVMSADAPTLRGIALELMGERATLTASRDDAADAFDRLVSRVWRAATGDTHEGPASVEVLLAAVEGLRSERDEARAIIEGRTTPPSDEEIAAHDAAGGSWTISGGWNSARYPVWLSDVEYVRNWRDGEATDTTTEGPPEAPATWRPLDAKRRPCAWPTAEAAR